MQTGPNKSVESKEFPPDDLLGGNFFKEQAMRGPAVRGRAAGWNGGHEKRKKHKTRKSQGCTIGLLG